MIEEFHTEIDERKHVLILARHEDSDMLMGSVSIEIEKSGEAVASARVEGMFVDAACRRIGVGSDLLGRCLTVARKHGCAGATLVVKPKNKAAIGLYRRFKFFIAAVYENGDLMMSRELAQ